MRYECWNNEIKLSKLGMGAMRCPQTAPGLGQPIDEEKARALIDCCMEQGVNYYDTAYIYHGGHSETFWVGRCPVTTGSAFISPINSTSKQTLTPKPSSRRR